MLVKIDGYIYISARLWLKYFFGKLEKQDFWNYPASLLSLCPKITVPLSGAIKLLSFPKIRKADEGHTCGFCGPRLFA